MKRILRAALGRFGYDLVRRSPLLPNFGPDVPDASKEIINRVRSFTMTSSERLLALLDAVTYLTKNNISGDIAECGVWRGGSMMATALALLRHGVRDRNLYLFDTFEGMPAPTEHDRSYDGMAAAEQLQREPPKTGIWCHASLDEVQANLLSTGYPPEKIHFIRGKVENTIPLSELKRLALLRLDTDWYASTKHELEHLYPTLVPNGVLIIDDYGHWQGARQAVDEYFAALHRPSFLHRIDYTGRLLIKPA